MIIPREGTYKHWTPTAIDCYDRRCKCEGCILDEFCSRRGQDVTYGIIPMKYAVLVLFALYGAPKERDYVNEQTDRCD